MLFLFAAKRAQHDCVYLCYACLCSSSSLFSSAVWHLAAQRGFNVKDATNCGSSVLPGVASAKLSSARHPPTTEHSSDTSSHITSSEAPRRLKEEKKGSKSPNAAARR